MRFKHTLAESNGWVSSETSPGMEQEVLHEDPLIPNYGKAGTGARIEEV